MKKESLRYFSTEPGNHFLTQRMKIDQLYLVLMSHRSCDSGILAMRVIKLPVLIKSPPNNRREQQWIPSLRLYFIDKTDKVLAVIIR